MHISKSIRWDKIVVVEASTLSTDFVCLSVSQTCANYLANDDLNCLFYISFRFIVVISWTRLRSSTAIIVRQGLLYVNRNTGMSSIQFIRQLRTSGNSSTEGTMDLTRLCVTFLKWASRLLACIYKDIKAASSLGNLCNVLTFFRQDFNTKSPSEVWFTNRFAIEPLSSIAKVTKDITRLFHS